MTQDGLSEYQATSYALSDVRSCPGCRNNQRIKGKDDSSVCMTKKSKKWEMKWPNFTSSMMPRYLGSDLSHPSFWGVDVVPLTDSASLLVDFGSTSLMPQPKLDLTFQTQTSKPHCHQPTWMPDSSSFFALIVRTGTDPGMGAELPG